MRHPPFLDPSLNAGFVVGRGSGGGVTYGDPEIGGRPPRYQNWNAGVQFALATRLTVSAHLRWQRGRFSRRQRPRLLRQSARPEVSGARQPAHAAGQRRQHRGGPGTRPGCRHPLPELLRHDRADAAAVSAVLGRHRRIRQRRQLPLSLAAAHCSKSAAQTTASP